jgi:quinol monooxygenase YgiN
MRICSRQLKARTWGTPKEYPGSLVFLVKLHIRPDKIAAAERALEKITEPTRANPDCLELRVFQDRDDPQSFTLLEHWVSLEANVAHGQRDYMAEYRDAQDHLRDPRPGREA